MNTLIALGSVWGVITITFAVLLLYRRSLTKKESDWIPLTDDGKEDKAIQAQTIIEMKTQKLTIPIRALGTLSLVMLLVIVGFWLFHTLLLRPPCLNKAQSGTDLGRNGRSSPRLLRLLPLSPGGFALALSVLPPLGLHAELG